MFVTKFSYAAIFALSFAFFSCQQGNEDVRNAARQDIETVNPANPDATAPDFPTVNVPAGPTTSVVFDESNFNFGTVNEGEVITHTYAFTNTGSEPLIVSDARSTCGCTVPSRPTAPIAPGETGEITVRFDTRSKLGAQSKPVTITANTEPAKTVITLEGNVLKDETAATQ